MKLLTLTLLGTGWVISSPGGEYTIDAEKACAAKDCKPTGEVQIDERGFWLLPSLDVDLRWASPTTVEIRKPRGAWVAAELTYPKPEGAPNPKAAEQVTQWERGVLPGRWVVATDACTAGSQAWFFDPLISDVAGRRVVGAKAEMEAHLRPCAGTETVGAYPGPAPKAPKGP